MLNIKINGRTNNNDTNIINTHKLENNNVIHTQQTPTIIHKIKLYRKILYLFSSTLINSLLVPSVDDAVERTVTVVRAGDSDGGVRTSSPCAPEVVGMLLIAIKKIVNILKI